MLKVAGQENSPHRELFVQDIRALADRLEAAPSAATALICVVMFKNSPAITMIRKHRDEVGFPEMIGTLEVTKQFILRQCGLANLDIEK